MRIFKITDEQEVKFKEWKEHHTKTCHLQPGSVGDLYQIHFTPSGIGDFVHITCPCGADTDLNDYASF